MPLSLSTDSLKIAEHFDMKHHNVLRAIDKCILELRTELKFELCKNFIENRHLSGPKGRQREYRKIDITEFGLTLLLLYINTPHMDDHFTTKKRERKGDGRIHLGITTSRFIGKSEIFGLL